MARTAIPRSVSDATRFTPTTPHAAGRPAGAPSHRNAALPRPPLPGTGSAAGETPDQRVARLRKAHLAARNAQVSRFDRIIVGARGFFDGAHKLTVVGLLGFTAIAALATVYTTYDMFTFNRKRRAEFFARQAEIEADSLEAARLAYMRGDATPEQIELVEEANERDAAAGRKPRGFFEGMPAVLSEPKAITAEGDEANQAAVGAAAAREGRKSQPVAEEKKGGWKSWFGSLGATVGGGEAKSASVAESARAALENEKGGPPDKVGLEVDAKGEPKKKSGWW